MGRKRIELSHAVKAEIAARTARHESADTIVSALHGTVSRSTIARMQAAIRNGTNGGQADPPQPTVGQGGAGNAPAKTSSDAAEVPDHVPEGTPLETLDRWIARVEKAACKAEVDGNLSAVASLSMRAASLMEARRKALPPPKIDPNENPDMRELAKTVEKRFFALVDDLFSQPEGAR